MLTVVIPTRNRPDFLARLLHYYAQTRCPYPIVVGDSSDPAPLDQTRAVIGRLEGTLRIVHRQYPTYKGYPSDLGMTETLSDLLQRVETKYVVFVADDDLVIPGAMEEAVGFLELHGDYSAVHGRAALCGLSGHVNGNVKWLQPYLLPQIVSSTAVERLRDHLRVGGATEFSVKVTDQMRAHWQARRALGMINRFGELLVSCLGAIQGKAHRMNRLYMVRQGHLEMDSRSPGLEELITDPNWSSQYVLFHDHLAQALARQDRIALEEAREVIQQEFFYHVVKIMLRKRSQVVQGWPGAQPLASRSSFGHALAQRLPVLHRGWQRLRSVLPSETNRMTLPALLHSNSPVHADFVPIYRALTGEHRG